MIKQTVVTAGQTRPALTPRQRANLELLMLEIEIKLDLQKREYVKQPVGEQKCLCLV